MIKISLDYSLDSKIMNFKYSYNNVILHLRTNVRKFVRDASCFYVLKCFDFDFDFNDNISLESRVFWINTNSTFYFHFNNQS
jgi:hypothetical protein